ncbi:MAG: outer membrane protein assembly factor BamE [Gammaproteobacteria bacterium]|nr:outer membrane protein assembly factor BamE [Gammaproteobacteria bacterium]
MRQRLWQIFIVLVLGFALTACFHVPVQQGNDLTAAKVHTLQKGMSRAQVYKLFGTPVLNNIYEDNTVYYVYTFKTEYNSFTKRWLVIEFYQNHVARFFMSQNLKPKTKKS